MVDGDDWATARERLENREREAFFGGQDEGGRASIKRREAVLVDEFDMPDSLTRWRHPVVRRADDEECEVASVAAQFGEGLEEGRQMPPLRDLPDEEQVRPANPRDPIHLGVERLRLVRAGRPEAAVYPDVHHAQRLRVHPAVALEVAPRRLGVGDDEVRAPGALGGVPVPGAGPQAVDEVRINPEVRNDAPRLKPRRQGVRCEEEVDGARRRREPQRLPPDSVRPGGKDLEPEVGGGKIGHGFGAEQPELVEWERLLGPCKEEPLEVARHTGARPVQPADVDPENHRVRIEDRSSASASPFGASAPLTERARHEADSLPVKRAGLVALLAALIVPLARGAVPGPIVTVAADLDHPRGLAVEPGGAILFTEPYLNVVRRLATDGTVATVAGTGAAAFSGDGGPALGAGLNFVHGVAVLPQGGYLVADTLNNRIRLVSAAGAITTVAGDGRAGFGGDGGPALQASINNPRGVSALPDGGFLIPDTNNHRIRRVWPDGHISTVAGTGTAGFSGDGGQATGAELQFPFGVSATAEGGFLIADGATRVRRVSARGIITTVAGNGVTGFAGDGGPPLAAELNGIHNVEALADGFLVADTGNNRVRLVRAGTIATVAGNGAADYAGEGGPAVSASLNLPKAIAVTPEGDLLVADSLNRRIRRVALGLHPIPALIGLRLLPPLPARAQKPLVVRYRLDLPATVVATLGRVSVRAAATAGAHRLVLRTRLPRGRYVLALRAAASYGRTARVYATLVLR